MGPRKVGKTHWITHNLAGAEIIDLLKTDVFVEYISRPALLRERYQDHRGLVVIDEVQKAPGLLDEVHWLIENRDLEKQLRRLSPGIEVTLWSIFVERRWAGELD